MALLFASNCKRQTLKIGKMLTRAKRRRLEEEEEDPAIIPSQHELEREAKIERAKVELMTLKVVDLKKELKLFGNPKIVSREYTGQYSGIKPSSHWSYLRSPYLKLSLWLWLKKDIVDWLANYKWLDEGSPFDLLPDELVLKIVEMAASKKKGFDSFDQELYIFDHDFIRESISRVDKRFNRIAWDSSLWQGVP